MNARSFGVGFASGALAGLLFGVGLAVAEFGGGRDARIGLMLSGAGAVLFMGGLIASGVWIHRADRLRKRRQDKSEDDRDQPH